MTIAQGQQVDDVRLKSTWEGRLTAAPFGVWYMPLYGTGLALVGGTREGPLYVTWVAFVVLGWLLLTFSLVLGFIKGRTVMRRRDGVSTLKSGVKEGAIDVADVDFVAVWRGYSWLMWSRSIPVIVYKEACASGVPSSQRIAGRDVVYVNELQTVFGRNRDARAQRHADQIATVLGVRSVERPIGPQLQFVS
jgi:hypothetical protein